MKIASDIVLDCKTDLRIEKIKYYVLILPFNTVDMNGQVFTQHSIETCSFSSLLGSTIQADYGDFLIEDLEVRDEGIFATIVTNRELLPYEHIAYECFVKKIVCLDCWQVSDKEENMCEHLRGFRPHLCLGVRLNSLNLTTVPINFKQTILELRQ